MLKYLKEIKIKNYFLILIISFVFAFWLVNQKYFFPYRIDIELQSQDGRSVQIFYGSSNLPEEIKSIFIETNPSKDFIKYSFPFLGKNIRFLRFDFQPDLKIKSIIIQNRFHRYNLNASNFYGEIKDFPVINPYPNFPNIVLVIMAAVIISIVLTLFFFIYKWFLATEFFGKYKRYIYFLFLLVNIAVSIYIIIVPPETKVYSAIIFCFLFIFFIPGYLLLLPLRKKLSPLENLFLPLPIGISFYTVVFYFVNQFHLKIFDWILYLFIIALVILFLFFFFKRKDYLIFKKISVSDLVRLWFVFNILFFISLIPTKGLFVAPLHDPVANSVMAKSLIGSNFSEFFKNNLFYPPGASYIVAIVSKISNVDTAKIVLVITNIFNVMTGFSFAFFIKSVFPKKNAFLFSLITFSIISSYVFSLYFLAGKNSQVMGYFFFFLSLGIFYRITKDNTASFYPKFIFVLTLIASFLIHYNNIALYLYFLPAIFIFNLIKNRNCSKKNIIHWSMLFIICTIIIFRQIALAKTANYNLFDFPIEKPFEISEIFFITNFWNFIQTKNIPESFLIQKTGLIAFLFLIFSSFKENFLVIFIGFPFFLYLMACLGLPTISSYTLLNIYMFKVFCVSLFICILYKKNKGTFQKFLPFLLILASIPNLYSLYNRYIDSRKLSPVGQSDLEAFQWVNKNIPTNEFFLPASVSCLNCSHEPYVLDSTLYLKVFTANEDCITSWSGNHCSHFNKKYINAYQKLIKNPNDKEAIDIFKRDNIFYIYSGSLKPWGKEGLDIKKLEEYDKFYSKIYDKDGVVIFRMI